MLILTRKPREIIRIGKDIKLIILAVDRGKVKIGFEAPDHIDIHREEVYQRIMLEDEAAQNALHDAMI